MLINGQFFSDTFFKSFSNKYVYVEASSMTAGCSFYQYSLSYIQYCSTTGKPTRSFATERVSLDSV
jgi:hypothetical protein